MENFTKDSSYEKSIFYKLFSPTIILLILAIQTVFATAINHNAHFDNASVLNNISPIVISTENLVGGPEIQLTIIEDDCKGQIGLLTVQVQDIVTYLWSTGETTESILITENGTYSVILTVVNTGGTFTDSIDVIELDPNGPSFSGYTILGQKDVKLHDRNTVLSGAVGASNIDGKIELKHNTNVYSFVQADDITIDNSSHADYVINTPAQMDLPDFVYNPYDDSKDDVKVETGETVTITGQIYRKIDVKKNAKLIIDTENIFARELKLHKESVVEFTGCTNVILSNNGLKLHQNTIFNPTGENVEVYSDHNVEIDQGSTVIANIYANDHQIHVKGKSGNPTSMKGFFSAWKIHGHDWVNWEFGELCDPCPVVFPDPTDSCECEGGMTQLTIAYSGGAGANLTVNSGVVTDNGDSTYTINTSTGEDKLEKNFEITDGQNVGQIHTSCSQDVLGNTYGGSFTVNGYIDSENNVSTIESCPVNIECDCHGGMTQLTIAYGGGSGANLTVNSGVVTDNGDSTYTINTSPGDDKLEKNFEISDGQNLGQIHTSCSKDILGMVYGNVFEVTGHIDSDGNVCATTSHIKPTGEDRVSIISYPNPTKSSFNILVNSKNLSKDVKVTVFRITNELVLSRTISTNTTISMGENLPSGLYFVKVETENHVEVIKVIKN